MTRQLLILVMVFALGQAVGAKPLPRPDRDAAPLPASSRVVVETSLGRFVLELFPEKAPITVGNFLQYVDSKHYDGTCFHRVIANFVVQAGGHLPDLSEKPTRPPIKNEATGLSNQRGTIAAARTSDPNSATAQFYINLKDNEFLDRAKSHDKVGYTVFGRVVEGMDTIERIASTRTMAQQKHSDVPVEPIVITSARRLAP